MDELRVALSVQSANNWEKLNLFFYVFENQLSDFFFFLKWYYLICNTLNFKKLSLKYKILLSLYIKRI